MLVFLIVIFLNIIFDNQDIYQTLLFYKRNYFFLKGANKQKYLKN
jgi:hypothetical protein